MAEDPINPLLGFFNALEQKKGAKGVVNDGKKVSATLTPEETARYTNIFKIMKDVVNPGPEAGTIAATPEATTPAGSTSTTDSTNTDKEKKDGFSLSSLLGLLPALGPALALMGPALGAALAGGLIKVFNEIDIKDALAEALAKWISPPKTDAEIEAEVTKKSGVTPETVTLLQTSNTILGEMRDLAKSRADRETRERIEEIGRTINQQTAGKITLAPGERQKLLDEQTDLEDSLLTEEEKGIKYQSQLRSLQALKNDEQKFRAKIINDRGSREAERRKLQAIVENQKSTEDILPELQRYAYLVENEEQLRQEEDERLEELVSRRRRTNNTFDRLLTNYIRNFKFKNAAQYREYFDPTSEYNVGLSEEDFVFRNNQFRAAMKAEFLNKFSAQDADDIMVNSNGDVYNLDSQDSLVAAKPGGPIDKMLDQNSAIQSQQLNVLVAIREEVNAIRSSMSSNVSVAGTALTQEFYAQ